MLHLLLINSPKFLELSENWVDKLISAEQDLYGKCK